MPDWFLTVAMLFIAALMIAASYLLDRREEKRREPDHD
jgi:hypothetical protein